MHPTTNQSHTMLRSDEWNVDMEWTAHLNITALR